MTDTHGQTGDQAGPAGGGGADPTESTEPATKHRRARRASQGRSGRALIVLSLLSATLVATVALGFWALNLYQAAVSGQSQAAAGARSLLGGDHARAESAFAEAAESFADAHALLGPLWLRSVIEAVPWLGRQVAAVDALATLGWHGSEAGGEVSGLLREVAKAGKKSGSEPNILGTPASRERADAALAAACAAVSRTSDLDEKGLMEPLATAARTVNEAIRPVAPLLDRCESIAELERFLMSKQRRFLVVSQHPGELKPTGGFIGSYGIVEIGPKRLGLESYQDIYFLDVPPELHIPSPPGDILTTWFKFRDANWWLDYPTSARALLLFWQEYGQAPVDGVIAIDTGAMSALLEVLGPVTVADHDETFTADNVLERLNYIIETETYERAQAGEKLQREDKKAVLAALAGQLTDQVLAGDPLTQLQSALALALTADEKHILFYFLEDRGQTLAREIGWSGSLEAEPGTTDLVAVSNAMNRAAKSNMGVRKQIDYQVELAPDGSAETTLALRYANTARYETPPRQRSVFSNYLQVYRAPGAQALPGPGTAPVGSSTTVGLGLPVEIRPFQLPRGRIHTEILRTRVPGATAPGRAPIPPRGPSANDDWAIGSASYYRLYLVRQPDLEDVPTRVTVSPPSGVRVTSANAWKAASGEPVAVTVTEGSVRVSTPLDGDLVLDVNLVSTPFGW